MDLALSAAAAILVGFALGYRVALRMRHRRNLDVSLRLDVKRTAEDGDG